MSTPYDVRNLEQRDLDVLAAALKPINSSGWHKNAPSLPQANLQVSRLELEYFKLGDEFEVPHVVGRDLEAKFKGRHANQQIGKRNPDSLSLTLSIDPSGPQRHLRGDGLHGND